MPCTSGFEGLEAESEVAVPSAALCAIITALEKIDYFHIILDAVDWEEAGVTKEELAIWWDKHKSQDAQRKLKKSKQHRENVKDIGWNYK
jgi:hypothetical protein